MAAEADPKRGASSIPGTAEPASAGRRFLLRGGLGAAPVLMTLASEPVAATTSVVCKTASAFTSITTSGRTGTTIYCSGRSPESWASTLPSGSDWVTYKPSTKFLSVFASTIQISDANVMFGSVLTAGPELARHCIAAVLNAAAGLVPSSILSVATAKSIWVSIGGGGYYEPTAGVNWYAPDAIAWIKSTYS